MKTKDQNMPYSRVVGLVKTDGSFCMPLRKCDAPAAGARRNSEG